ncbi:hypothetical protein BJX62DRAFT_241455 [Aspergillus germanicus]
MPSPARLSGVRPPVDPNSVLARVQARPASRLTYTLRAPTRANLGPPAHSFLPYQPRRDRVRYLHTRYHTPTSLLSFNRTTAPTARPSFTRDAVPTYRPSFLRHAIVEQRRLASNKPTAPTGAVRKNKPGKSVRFAEQVTVRPVTRWINKPVKHVHFAPTLEVIPVTRWIDRREHVSRIPVLRTRFRATHALSNAQIDSTRMVSGSKTKRVKHVHFGETTTHTVTRWIEPVAGLSFLPPSPTTPTKRPNTLPLGASALPQWSANTSLRPETMDKPQAHSVSWLVSGPDLLNGLPTWSFSNGFARRRQSGSRDTPCYNHGPQLPILSLKPFHDTRFLSTSRSTLSFPPTAGPYLRPSTTRLAFVLLSIGGAFLLRNRGQPPGRQPHRRYRPPSFLRTDTKPDYNTDDDIDYDIDQNSDSHTDHYTRHSTLSPLTHRPTATIHPNYLEGDGDGWREHRPLDNRTNPQTTPSPNNGLPFDLIGGRRG